MSTDKCVFRYRQSNVRRLLPASNYCRARCNEMAEHSSDKETRLGSSRKLGGAAEHVIGGSQKRICLLSFDFRVRMLLKGAVTLECSLQSFIHAHISIY